MALARVNEPFIFKTQLSLISLIGLKARDLGELRLHLGTVPESSVYYHTHHFLQQHHFLTPEPPNDFAYWATQVLREEIVGEKLAAVDTTRFQTLEELRRAILNVLDDFLKDSPVLRKSPEGQEFYFMKAVLFTIPTSFRAHDLMEFLDALKKVSIHCLYNHIFSGRMRPPLGINDFSNWMQTALRENVLARRIQSLDPYTYTMEGLRNKIIRYVEKRIEELTRDQVR